MTENDQMRLTDARNSFTGKALTVSQFDEAWAVAGIMDREIRKSGMFREKLGLYAQSFASSEKFDQIKGGVRRHIKLDIRSA